MPAERQRFAAVLAVALPLAGAAADAPKATPPAAPPAAVDAELLEFLGEFDDAKGEFVDPFVIDAVSTVVDDAARAEKRKQKKDATKKVEDPATQAPVAPPEKTP